MKRIKVSTKKGIGRKMTKCKARQIKVRNTHIQENIQLTIQQQKKIKEFEDLFM